MADETESDRIELTMWVDGNRTELSGEPFQALYYAATKLSAEDRLTLIEKLQDQHAVIEAQWR